MLQAKIHVSLTVSGEVLNTTALRDGPLEAWLGSGLDGFGSKDKPGVFHRDVL